MNYSKSKIIIFLLFVLSITILFANNLSENISHNTTLNNSNISFNNSYNLTLNKLILNKTESNKFINITNNSILNNKSLLNYSNNKIKNNTLNNKLILNKTESNKFINITNNSILNKNKINHYLKVNISGYKITIYTNGELKGFTENKENIKFIKIGKSEYILSPVILNTNLYIYSKKGNNILNKTIFLNYSKNNTENNNNINNDFENKTNYLNISFKGYKPIIKTNGNLNVIYENNNISVKISKIGDNTYTFYPLILENNITIYSTFKNNITINKTIFLNYSKNNNENNNINNNFENNKIKYKYVAYDPVNKKLIIRLKNNDVVKIKTNNKNKNEIIIPANNENLKKYGLSENILKTKIYTKNISKNKIKVVVENKLDVWYRFSTKIPKGYRVKEIVREDGRKIINNISINRTTGEIIGELNWYVENNTLYFYDDPVYGYDISLIPPAPNNSLAIELAYETETGGKCGQISAIVFPYNDGDSSLTIRNNDHAGRMYDGEYGNEIDEYAGSKIAIKYKRSSGWYRQYGNIGTAYLYYLQEINRTDVPLNTVPNGILESAILTNMITSTTSNWKLNITQKLIIRGNNKWFATIYYIKNPASSAYYNLKFFQGMDWNFQGSFLNDDCYYDSSNDLVYGYKNTLGGIKIGGFKSNLFSSEHDVNYYNSMWWDIRNDNLNNGSSYNGDAGVALAWTKDKINPSEVWVIPIIWGLGFNTSDMYNEINKGLSQLYDTGVKSIDYPNNEDSFNPNIQQIVNINSTIALYGLVDVNNLNVSINVSQINGTYTFENSTLLNLSVPFNEQKQITFPLNITNIPYGTYNITISTNLPNDQNISNNNKSIIIKIISFSVEPNEQTKLGNNSDTIYYNITAYNNGVGSRFDINITNSTKQWNTKLYDNNMNIIAEDNNGDGIWDYINSNYDINNNGIPDMYIDTTPTNITFSKTIPLSAPLGEIDKTTFNFININNIETNDYSTIYTKNPTPPLVHKTFYLNGDSNYTLNTTPQSNINNYTSINGNSFKSWVQIPKFANDFKIYGNIPISLYMNSSSTDNRKIVVSLLYTDGTTSQTIGSDTLITSLSNTISLKTFNILLDSPITIPENNYLVLKVENQQSTTSINIYHDINYKSNITLNTTTYVNVNSIKTDKEYYLVNDTIKINANITDPIGSYDIAGANITIYYPNGTLYLKDSMDLNYTDSSNPSLWKDYNYSFKPTVMGIYNITITGIESNGVLNNLSKEVICGVIINGQINEDFGTLGINDSNDIGVVNTKVYLFNDSDNNGILTNNDTLLNETETDTVGHYNFVIYNNNSNYFVAIDSKKINPYYGFNNNYNISDIWVEQTYQTQWNGTKYTILPKFGGQNPTISDNFGTNYEHYLFINLSKYSGESVDFGFSYDVVVNTKDSKDDLNNTRYAQGSFRQFIINSNAIKNGNYMKFIPMVSPNEQNNNTNKWWSIVINDSIGILPEILDNNTVIDGTAYYPNMTIRNDNQGVVGTGGTVGTGADNLPNSGDEILLPKFNLTELEINGNGIGNILTIGNNTLNPSNVFIKNLAIYNGLSKTGIFINGGCNNFTVENNIIGLRANGSYTTNRLNYGIRIDDSTLPSIGGLIKHNYIGYCKGGNIAVGYSGSGSENLNTIIQQNELFMGEMPNDDGDNLLIYADNITIKENLIRDNIIDNDNDYLNSGKGIEVRSGANNIKIINNTIKNSQSCGILYSDDSNDGLIKNNIIYNNSLGGIVISDKLGSPVNITISKNSIYNNSRLGIDLDDNSGYGDNVSLNDGITDSSKPNYGIDYPVINYSDINNGILTITGFINNESANTGSSTFGNAIVDIYLVRNGTIGDNLTGNNYLPNGAMLNNYYGEGYLYLGTLTADSNGNFNGTIDVSNLNLGKTIIITATSTMLNYGTSEFGRNYLINNNYYHILGSIYNTNNGYNISIKSYNNTDNVYVYWYKPESVGVITISGDYDLNGINGSTYWFKFNNINANEIKNITITTNITTMDGLIIGIDPNN